MKKRWIAWMLAIVLVLMTAACGGNEEQKEQTPDDQQNEETAGEDAKEEEPDANEDTGYEPTYGDVEIDFWYLYDQNTMETLIAKYMEDHPNVKINGLWINLWDFASKLTPAFAGGTAPDVVLGSTLAQDAAEGNIVNLTEALEERGFDESRYLPGAIEAMTYDGDYYGIPFVGGTRLFYWNKDIFEAAGLDPDQPPATWEEVAQFAEKTTTFDEDGNATILGFHHEYSNLYAWTTLWTYGVELMDGETPTFNNDATREAIATFQDIQEAVGGRDVMDIWNEAALTTEMGNAFIAGEMAMIVDTSNAPKNISNYNPDLNYGVATIPTSDGTNNKASWGDTTCVEIVDKGDEDRLNAAIDFALWLCEEEAQIMWMEGTGDLSPLANSSELYREIFPEYSEEYYTALEEALPGTRANTYLRAYPSYNNDINTAFNQAVSGEKTVDQALDDAEATIIQEIENYHLMND